MNSPKNWPAPVMKKTSTEALVSPRLVAKREGEKIIHEAVQEEMARSLILESHIVPVWADLAATA